MPTVKTQDGKVVTKDGKVSCECCGSCKSDIFNIFAMPAGLPVWSQPISPELYNDLKILTSASVDYALNVQVQINMGISEESPSGYAFNFSQTIGQTYENFNKANPLFYGPPNFSSGCDLAFALSYSGGSNVAFSLPNLVSFPLQAYGNLFLTTALRVSLYMFLRDGGPGFPDTEYIPTNSVPVMYVAGKFEIYDFGEGSDDPRVKPNFLPNNQPSSVRFTFSDSGTESADVNILGFPAKSLQTFNANGGSHIINWKVFLTAPPP
jgi:hypothetical protein